MQSFVEGLHTPPVSEQVTPPAVQRPNPKKASQQEVGPHSAEVVHMKGGKPPSKPAPPSNGVELHCPPEHIAPPRQVVQAAPCAP